MCCKVYKTKQTKKSFPKWYCDSFWTHMTLVQTNENECVLIPPNQLDWNIRMIYKDTSWVVEGKRTNAYEEEDEFIEEYITI